jgi:hypothetical protein
LWELVSTFRKAKGEREALIEFVAAECEHYRCSPLFGELNPEPISIWKLRTFCAFEGDVTHFLETATDTDLAALQKHFIESVIFSVTSARFFISRRGRGRSLEARIEYAIANLEEALSWMVWFDEYSNHPLQCCEECLKIFRPQTGHKRKFCDDPRCGKRVAARKWRKADLANKRLAKEQSQTRRKNGTHKTR